MPRFSYTFKIMIYFLIGLCIIHTQQSFSMALWRKNNPSYDPKTNKIRRSKRYINIMDEGYINTMQLKRAKSIQEQSLIQSNQLTSMLDTLTSLGETDIHSRKKLQQTCIYMHLYFDTKNKENLFRLIANPFFEMSDDEVRKAFIVSEWYGRDNIQENIFFQRYRDNAERNQKEIKEAQIPFFEDLNYELLGYSTEPKTRYCDLKNIKKISYEKEDLSTAEIFNTLGTALLVDDVTCVHRISQKMKPEQIAEIKKLGKYYLCYSSLFKIAINADSEKAFIAFIKNDPFLNSESKHTIQEIAPQSLLYDIKHSKYVYENRKKKYIDLFQRHGGINLQTPHTTKAYAVRTQTMNSQNNCVIF